METQGSPSAGERGHGPTALSALPVPVPVPVTQPPREAVNHTWYDHYYGGHDSYLAILLANPFHPGPWAVPTSWRVPVGMEDCSQTQDICNGQLKPGSQYR